MEETGWKLLHREVFRPPNNLMFLSAILGTGAQLFVIFCSVLFTAEFGAYYQSRGAVLTSFIVGYFLTNIVSGYISGAIYIQNKGLSWKKTMVLTSLLLPTVLTIGAFFLNSISNNHGSLSFIPFGTIVILSAMWLFITFPLTVVGTILGRSFNRISPQNPAPIFNAVPRMVPVRPWYLDQWPAFFISGILPFSSILIELYYIYSSWWHYKFFYTYGLAILVFLAISLIVSCQSVILTFLKLNAEDYRWRWFSFFNGFSISFFMLVYSFYYFRNRTEMTGTLQTLTYFTYNFLFSLISGLLFGSISHWASARFIRKIYQDGKFE